MNTYTLPDRMLSLLEAFDTDAEFSATVTGLLRAHGHPNFTVPVVGQAQWSDYPKLLSCADTHDYPVLIIALPHSIKAEDALALITSALLPFNVTSHDLQTTETNLVAVGKSVEIHMLASAIFRSINDVKLDRLKIIWLCRDTVFIVDHSIDEEWRANLDLSVMSADANYGANHQHPADVLKRRAGATAIQSDEYALEILNCEVYRRRHDEQSPL